MNNVNSFLYVISGGGGSGGYRKLKKGEHYEDVQKEMLENEIRIKERRERYRHNDHPKSSHRQSYQHRGPRSQEGSYHRSDHRSSYRR